MYNMASTTPRYSQFLLFCIMCIIHNLGKVSGTVYVDVFSGDEIFSDTHNYKIELLDGVLYQVQGSQCSRPVGEIDEDGNAIVAGIETGIDFVLNHRLVVVYAFTRESYEKYLADYVNRVVARLQESSPNSEDEVDLFKTNTVKVMGELMERFKDLQFFTGESMDPDGLAAIVEYKDVDGENTPFLYALKHGLEEKP